MIESLEDVAIVTARRAEDYVNVRFYCNLHQISTEISEQVMHTKHSTHHQIHYLVCVLATAGELPTVKQSSYDTLQSILSYKDEHGNWHRHRLYSVCLEAVGLAGSSYSVPSSIQHQSLEQDDTPVGCIPQMDGRLGADVYDSMHYRAASVPTLDEKQANP